MRHERQTGLAFSVTLHLLLLLLLIFGLPSIFKNPPPIEPAAITVELLPITGVTNVKPVEGTQLEKPKPEEPKPEPEQKKPAPPVKTAQDSPPPPPKAEPKPTPKDAEKIPDPTKVEKKPEEKKPEPKKEEPKKDEKPKKAKEDDLDAILKAVKETANKEKTDKKPNDKKESAPTQKVVSTKYDASLPMSLSEKDAIMSQIAKCWSPPAGAKDAKNLAVVIKAEFNVDGSLIKAEIADESKGRYNSDPFFRSAAEAALRAVRHPDCTPLKNLPPEKYGTWKSMELNFDPQFML